MSITTIGLDTAKSVFQIHGVDETGKAEIKRKLRRSVGRHTNPRKSRREILALQKRVNPAFQKRVNLLRQTRSDRAV